jgi:hypothetical protein
MLDGFSSFVGEFLKKKPEFVSVMWVKGDPITFHSDPLAEDGQRMEGTTPKVHAEDAEPVNQFVNWLYFQKHISEVVWIELGRRVAELELLNPDFEWQRPHSTAADGEDDE